VRNLLDGFEVMEVPLEEAAMAHSSLPGTELIQRFKQKVKSGFGAKPELPRTPVLLVDDVVDSGWTLTVGAVLLREHGSGPVYPFALARASLRGS